MGWEERENGGEQKEKNGRGAGGETVGRWEVRKRGEEKREIVYVLGKDQGEVRRKGTMG